MRRDVGSKRQLDEHYLYISKLELKTGSEATSLESSNQMSGKEMRRDVKRCKAIERGFSLRSLNVCHVCWLSLCTVSSLDC